MPVSEDKEKENRDEEASSAKTNKYHETYLFCYGSIGSTPL